MDALMPWVSAQLRRRLGNSGQADLIVALLILVLLYLLVTGRRVVVQ